MDAPLVSRNLFPKGDLGFVLLQNLKNRLEKDLF
jgi:hypothetical protein